MEIENQTKLTEETKMELRRMISEYDSIVRDIRDARIKRYGHCYDLTETLNNCLIYNDDWFKYMEDKRFILQTKIKLLL